MSDWQVWTINNQIEETGWQAIVAAARQPSNQAVYGVSAAHELISLIFSFFFLKKSFKELGFQEQVLEREDCKTQKFPSVQAASKQKVPTSCLLAHKILL